MGELYELPPPRPGFKEKWIRPPDAPRTEEEAEVDYLWARAWRSVELQKAIESIARTDGWLRVIYQIPFSTWKAYRSKD